MRTLLFLLLCISTSFAIAQISPKAVEKNKEAEIDSLESEMMNFFKRRWKGIMVEKMLLTY